MPQPSRIEGLEIKRDGVVAGPPLWGTQIPIDPGSHTVEASAPGRKPWKSSVEVGANGASVTVSVPVFERSDTGEATAAPAGPVEIPPPPPAKPVGEPREAPTPATAPSATPAPASLPSDVARDKGGGTPGSTQKTIALVVGGVGVVGLGAGMFLGLRAKSRYDESADFCSSSICSQQGLDIRDDAKSKGNVATIVGGLGAAALAGGAVLYFTAPSGSDEAQASVRMGPGSVWLSQTF